MNRNAFLFLTGATLVGGFAIGRAALAHIAESKAGRSTMKEYEQAPADPVQDVVSYLIVMTIFGYGVYQAPRMVESWRAQFSSILE